MQKNVNYIKLIICNEDYEYSLLAYPAMLVVNPKTQLIETPNFITKLKYRRKGHNSTSDI